eukprot:11813690-Prorocentrum_lima.AAC.1
MPFDRGDGVCFSFKSQKGGELLVEAGMMQLGSFRQPGHWSSMRLEESAIRPEGVNLAPSQVL